MRRRRAYLPCGRAESFSGTYPHKAIETRASADTVTKCNSVKGGQCSSIVGDHEVCQLPGVLISLDLDLLRLLIHRQFAGRQHRAGALAVGREDQLNGT